LVYNFSPCFYEVTKKVGLSLLFISKLCEFGISLSKDKKVKRW